VREILNHDCELRGREAKTKWMLKSKQKNEYKPNRFEEAERNIRLRLKHATTASLAGGNNHSKVD
jgi:hypothetical protein